MTSPAYTNKAIELLYPTLPILKIALLHSLSEGMGETPVYFFQNPDLPLDDINRVKMVWVVEDGEGAFIQEVNGQTVMIAFKNSLFLGFNWAMSNGEAFNPKAISLSKLERAGHYFQDQMISLAKAFGLCNQPEIKKSIQAQQGLSDFVYFYGRAKSLYIALSRLQAQHGDFHKDEILYPANPQKRESVAQLSSRTLSLIQALYAYKGYTPASPQMQAVLNGLQDALLSLRNSMGGNKFITSQDWRRRASSGLLRAEIYLRKMHQDTLKGGL